jgi:hypothetical protein
MESFNEHPQSYKAILDHIQKNAWIRAVFMTKLRDIVSKESNSTLLHKKIDEINDTLAQLDILEREENESSSEERVRQTEHLSLLYNDLLAQPQSGDIIAEFEKQLTEKIKSM